MEEIMKKKNSAVIIGIASVWFGAHCGPGVASGNQIATFYSKYSILGIFTGLIAMIALGLCIFYSIEYARLTKSYDFKSFANKFYAPYEKFFANFFEVTYAATVLMVLGSCIATGAAALNQQFGLPMWIGQASLALITILLTIFGADLVRKSSSAMTIIIMISLGVMIVVAIATNSTTIAEHFAQKNVPEFMPKAAEVSPLMAIWSAILYAGFQSAGNIANAVSVSEGLESREDSRKAAIYGILINAILIIAVALMLFAYPDVLNEFFNPNRPGGSFIPNLIVAKRLGSPIYSYLYLIALLLAIITTLVSFAYAVAARYGKLLPIKAGVKRDLVAVIIMLVLCTIVSFVGLDAIVSKGFKYLAYACIAVVIIPTILIGHKKITNFKEVDEKQ